jgi:uncharacterized protein (DUF1330 family)
MLLDINSFEPRLTQKEATMKTHHTVALALLAGAALGAAAIQTLHAQAAPKAYVVAQNVVKDEAGYMKDFAPSMSKAIEAAGGKYLVRGGKVISMHGAAPTSRVVLLQFDSVDKAQAWANAAATKELFDTGEKYATLNDYIVEGVSQ